MPHPPEEYAHHRHARDLSAGQIVGGVAVSVVGFLVFPVGAAAALGLATINGMRITNLEGEMK